MKKIHDLKIGPFFFNAVSCGDKKAEFRENDRDFMCGDFLRLREWDGEYTGSELMVVITHILPIEKLIPGAGSWAMLSIERIDSVPADQALKSDAGGEL